jgi:hypothetical protein
LWWPVQHFCLSSFLSSPWLYISLFPYCSDLHSVSSFARKHCPLIKWFSLIQ